MGDTRRFHFVAELVTDLFPPSRFHAAADVAGGKGKLAGKLIKRGYSATIIDPRRSRKHPRGAVRMSQPFLPGMARRYDVLVGLHPDGATEALVLSAKRRPVVIVPCCLHDWAGPEEGSVEQRIRSAWRRMGIAWQEIDLGFNGRSLTFVGGPNG